MRFIEYAEAYKKSCLRRYSQSVFDVRILVFITILAKVRFLRGGGAYFSSDESLVILTTGRGMLIVDFLIWTLWPYENAVSKLVKILQSLHSIFCLLTTYGWIISCLNSARSPFMSSSSSNLMFERLSDECLVGYCISLKSLLLLFLSYPLFVIWLCY